MISFQFNRSESCTNKLGVIVLQLKKHTQIFHTEISKVLFLAIIYNNGEFHNWFTIGKQQTVRVFTTRYLSRRNPYLAKSKIQLRPIILSRYSSGALSFYLPSSRMPNKWFRMSKRPEGRNKAKKVQIKPKKYVKVAARHASMAIKANQLVRANRRWQQHKTTGKQVDNTCSWQ